MYFPCVRGASWKGPCVGLTCLLVQPHGARAGNGPACAVMLSCLGIGVRSAEDRAVLRELSSVTGEALPVPLKVMLTSPRMPRLPAPLGVLHSWYTWTSLLSQTNKKNPLWGL